MKIRALNRPRNLIKRNIVKPLKTRSINRPHPMIRHQKQLFPPHIDNPLLRVVADFVVAFLHCGGVVGCKVVEDHPVREIPDVVGAPVGVLSLEGVFCADDFAFEEGGEAGVVFCEAWGGISLETIGG